MKRPANPLTRITKTLESVLENQDHFRENEGDFVESDQPSLMSGLSVALPTDEFDKALILFSRLNLLFYAGFFFERLNHQQFQLQAFFEEGWVKLVEAAPPQLMIFPEQRLDEIKIAPAHDVLTQMNFKLKSSPQDMRSLLVHPAADYSFILLSRRPDPWLKLNSEKILKALLDGLSL